MKFNKGLGLVLGLMLVSANAFAESALSAGYYAEEVDEALSFLYEGGSPYDELERLFDQGTLPSQSDILGWYSGRAYWKLNPMKPRNSILVGEMVSFEGDGGPLFPPQEILKVYSLTNRGEPKNRYDTLTSEIESDVRSYLDSSKGWPTIWPIQTQGESLVSYHVDGLREYHIRKVTLPGKLHEGKSYLVEKFVHDGKVHMYGYYFKKVK